MKPGFIANVIICLVFSIALFLTQEVRADETVSVLDAAELTFKSMKDRSYNNIWRSVTQRSRNTIVKDVFKAVAKTDNQYSEEQILNDFKDCSTICKSYWDGYLQSFDPNTALEQSKWGIGFIKKSEAEIIITYEKAEKPAVLKMFREDGVWKVGLVETFWTRK